MNVRRLIARGWDSAVAIAAAVAAGCFLTKGVIESVTTEVIAFYTIQSAVIFPAMIFTAGLLRGDGLSVLEVERYRAALRRQMSFWITLLSLDLLAVAMVIVGKAAGWKWKITIMGASADFGPVLIGCSALLGSLAVLRMAPFVRGVSSLLELNGLLVRRAVEAREANSARITSETVPTSMSLPKNYGRVLPRRKVGRSPPRSA